MAQIYNSEVTRELLDGAKIQIQADIVPNQLAEKVVPVMEVNPSMLRVVNIVKSVNASATIHTCKTTAKTYLVGATLSSYSDTAGAGLRFINCVPVGTSAATIFLQNDHFVNGVITADSKVSTFTPCIPIQLERGTNIICTSSGATSSGVLACIFLYEVLD